MAAVLAVATLWRTSSWIEAATLLQADTKGAKQKTEPLIPEQGGLKGSLKVRGKGFNPWGEVVQLPTTAAAEIEGRR